MRPPARPQCGETPPATLVPPGVEVELQLSSPTIDRGKPLRLKVTVRNEGLLPVIYHHSGYTHDFWIRDERGVIWLWSQGKTFTDQLEQDRLDPGESRSAQAKWVSQCSPDGRRLKRGLPGPGTYTAQALWVSQTGDQDGAWWSNEVQFTIRP